MELFDQCSHVLEKNWRGHFTIPSPRLYPFQWNWDSGFISIGLLHINPQRALLEMETLFSGQWENGFLPHILFHDSHKYKSYFPSADYWNSSVSSFSPKDLKTSGITQPPVHGFVLEQLFDHGFEKERIAKLFDQIVEYHKYLYSYREYDDSGLVAIWHNWESGMDNSIWWDDIFNEIDHSDVEGVELHRKDVHEVEESENTRPKDSDYKRYIYLLDWLRDLKFETIPNDFPFQVLDPVFNSILIEANTSLIRIGKKLGRDTSFIQKKWNTGFSNFSKYLWNDQDSLFYPFDLVSNKQIQKHCSGCYIPIFASLPSSDQVEKLISHFDSFSELFLLPSCIPDQKGFESKNYWRGPVWVNMNWLIWKGLLKYKKIELANKVKNSTIDMVKKYGIYEYFEPYIKTTSKTGFGGIDFSWSAALIIDMLRNGKI